MSSINVQVNRNNNIINVGINSTGPQGQSAYETWLSLGNTGTKQDFINSQFDESTRVLNENTRNQSELTRIANENERIAAENIRQQQESSRQQEFESNEITRQTNETVRTSNEEARQEADILRGQTVEAIEQNYAPRLTTVEGQINSFDAKTSNSISVLEYINLVANIGTEFEDWTSAFQTAINWLSSKGGGNLIVPHRTEKYKIYAESPTINNPKRVLITSDNINIIGLGKPVIVMNGINKAYIDSINDYSSSGRDVFTAFSFVGVENCSIENISFEGTWDGLGVFRFASPRAKAVGFIGSKNCYANNLYGFGVLGNLINATNSMIAYDGFFKKSIGIKVTNCYAVQCLENGVNYMGGTENCTFSNNIMESCGAAGFEAGTSQLTVIGNICRKNKQAGITVAGTDITIEGNECNENGSDIDSSYGLGISVTGAASYLAGRIKIKNNSINKNKGFGIQIYPGAYDVDIDGNQLIDNCLKNVSAYNYGIYVVGSSLLKIKDVKIYGNVVKDSVGNMINSIVMGNIENAQVLSNLLKVHKTKSVNVYIQGTSKYVEVCANVMNKTVFIETAALMCNAYNNIGEYYYRKTLEGSALPTKGTWEKGESMQNISPAELGTAGSMYVVDAWKCKQSGTFGTLTGITGSIVNGQTVLTVNDASPFAVGQYIIIAGVTGGKKIAEINGNEITLTVVASATVTDAVVSFTPPLFFEMRSLTGN